MRHPRSALVMLALLLSAGCSDRQLREAGRGIEQAVGERWEAFRQQVDQETKARAQRRQPARAQQQHGRVDLAEYEEEPPPARASSPDGGLDRAALAEIVAIAQQQHAQSLVVKRRGKVVLARRWGRQDDLHPMMQITYPIVALTMGQLVAEGHVPSLDTPIGRWLPAFREGKKGLITLRHVMTGRDGLKGPGFPDGLYHKPYYIGFFAGDALENEPGQGQVLPRESVVLLGAVVKAATGMPLDRWVATRLLEPLGIHKSRWRQDKAGNFDAWAGLWLPPEGALKIGELVLNEGRWNGRQVLPRAWVLEATSPAGTSEDPLYYPEAHGYGWRVGERKMHRKENLPDTGRIAPNRIRVADRRYGVQSSDYLGQHLIINPTKQLVALHTVPWDGRPVTHSIIEFEFDSLADQLDAAAR